MGSVNQGLKVRLYPDEDMITKISRVYVIPDLHGINS